MSLHLPSFPENTRSHESGSESSDSDDDQDFGDWMSDVADEQPCQSLFDQHISPNVEESLSYDKKTYGVDFEHMCKKLALDFHQRIRLINYIRKEKAEPSFIKSINGQEGFFSVDEYLIPAVKDDPLLQHTLPNDWSDSEFDEQTTTIPLTDLPSALRRIKALESRLKEVEDGFSDYRAFVSKHLDSTGILAAVQNDGKAETCEPAGRDDDSHYFQSYGENEIHAIMIQDRVRTSTYASFVLRNPQIFRDAVVLDVGCGTGILSLFAARAGAKRVFAVDASDIAEKASRIVKDNDMDDVITVIKGKIEEISLPDGYTHVDIIISEWMGYALLYESMLDSVLIARDRFLKSTAVIQDQTLEGSQGIMAPSQTRIMLGLSDASDVYKERISFWHDVHGFDLSAMTQNVYEDAIIDVVPAESMISDPVVIKDIFIPTATPHTLSFSAPFKLVSTADRRDTRVRAFCLYFDTFFTTNGAQVASDEQVQLSREGDLHLAEVWPVGAGLGRRRSSQTQSSLTAETPKLEKPGTPRKPSLKRAFSEKEEATVAQEMKPQQNPLVPQRRTSLGDSLRNQVTSFSTGPWSIPTHWKQTIFLLREPLIVKEGSVVSGTFYMRKSPDNKRELDVEIHYETTHPPLEDGKEQKDKHQGRTGKIVQMFKVR